jgi:uncharacterized protein (DUF58 family)
MPSTCKPGYALAAGWLAGFLAVGFFAALTGFLVAGFFAAFLAALALTAAHRLRCASAIRFRAATLSLRRFAVLLVDGVAVSMLDSSTRAFWSLSSSASIAAMIEFVSIRIFLSQKSYSNLIYNSGHQSISIWGVEECKK